MAVEIEKKFLVDHSRWVPAGPGIAMEQGYVSTIPERTVRIRITDDKAFLTLKGMASGITRPEFEYPIPLDDASTMLQTMCEKPALHKTRYTEVYHGKTWEIDVFHGDNMGLITAEIELASEDETFIPPDFITSEVTHDAAYTNSNLAEHPFRSW